MKIVINSCFGGFSLSVKATLWLYERGFDAPGFKQDAFKYFGRDEVRLHRALKEWRSYLKNQEKRSMVLTVFSPDEKYCLYFNRDDQSRSDKLLVECVETLGSESYGDHASLRIVEIPDDVKWEIQEYDGMEHVAESHRTWG